MHVVPRIKVYHDTIRTMCLRTFIVITFCAEQHTMLEIIGKCIVVILVAVPLFESAKRNAINIITTTPKIMQGRAALETLRKMDPERLKDDTEKVVSDIETLRILPLIEMPTLKNLSGKPITNESVATPELVQYISEVQAVVVALRQSYLDILRGHAEWTARWYEVHFPDYYPCVTRNLIRLMRESMVDYPKKVIMKIRTVKDAFLRSFITKEPISKVDPEVFDGLNALLENMPKLLEQHRDGKGDHSDGVEFVLEKQVSSHEKTVRERCQIPLTDGHSACHENQDDLDYTGDEDYTKIDYIQIA